MVEYWSNQKYLEILLQYRGMGTLLPKTIEKKINYNKGIIMKDVMYHDYKVGESVYTPDGQLRKITEVTSLSIILENLSI